MGVFTAQTTEGFQSTILEQECVIDKPETAAALHRDNLFKQLLKAYGVPEKDQFTRTATVVFADGTSRFIVDGAPRLELGRCAVQRVQKQMGSPVYTVTQSCTQL